jgi:hypothetical protein
MKTEDDILFCKSLTGINTNTEKLLLGKDRYLLHGVCEASVIAE